MSELRQDITSGDWVIMAPGRASRPKFLDKKKAPRPRSPKSTCPFESLEKSGNWPPLLAFPNADHWETAVIPNKYPAVAHEDGHSAAVRSGIYRSRTAVGTHALLVTRDHKKNFADIDRLQALKVFEMFQELHRMGTKDPCAAYVSTFCNWGQGAGASLGHPHYQSLTLPIIPPNVAHSIRGAEEYYKEHGRCVRCDIIRAERAKKVRVIAEYEHAIAIAPFASKKAFEVSILPKRHHSSFRDTPHDVLRDMAFMLQHVLRRLRDRANDPDFNFFLHDAPLDGKDYSRHHWHIEVVPVNVISPPGGFEVSTTMNINSVEPEKAAAILR